MQENWKQWEEIEAKKESIHFLSSSTNGTMVKPPNQEIWKICTETGTYNYTYNTDPIPSKNDGTNKGACYLSTLLKTSSKF